jgi:RimJ/RimL family protein N-acetyltransferase
VETGSPVVIEGTRFVLRPHRPGDEASLARHANNRKIWRNLRDGFPHPYTLEAAKDWIRQSVEAPAPYLTSAIVVDDEVIGGIGLVAREDVYSHTAEVGYWLSEAYWGRGIATEAVCLIVRHAFDELHLARLEAGVFAWNPASARVLEKNGFRLDARLENRIYKDGEFTDELLYSRLP